MANKEDNDRWLSSILDKAMKKDPEPTKQQPVKVDVKEVEEIMANIRDKIQRG